MKKMLQLATICLLSVALFGAGFVGFNRAIFAAAIRDVTPLPALLPAERIPLPAPRAGDFTPPTLTVSDITERGVTRFPHAMTAEEAAQTGARYIWDVLGHCIDGAYVRMQYRRQFNRVRDYWTAMVFAYAPDYTLGYDEITDPHPFFEHVTHLFWIDAVTGMPVELSSFYPRMISTWEEFQAHDDFMAEIAEATGENWNDMPPTNQLRFLHLTQDDLAPYIQTARAMADAHFQTTGLTGTLHAIEIQSTPSGPQIAAIVYILTHYNRETFINVPTTAAHRRQYEIQTQHNDFQPPRPR